MILTLNFYTALGQIILPPKRCQTIGMLHRKTRDILRLPEYLGILSSIKRARAV